MISIYGLYDANGDIRYIGQAKNPRGRLYNHWRGRNSSRLNRKNAWLRSLDEPPSMKILVIVEDDMDNWSEADYIESHAIISAAEKFGWSQITNEIAWSRNGLARYTLSSPEYSTRQSMAVRNRLRDNEYRMLLSESVSKKSKAQWDADPIQSAKWYADLQKNRRYHSPLANPNAMDRPCKQCGAPVGVFSIDPPCMTCDRRRRNPYWTKHNGDWNDKVLKRYYVPK